MSVKDILSSIALRPENFQPELDIKDCNIPREVHKQLGLLAVAMSSVQSHLNLSFIHISEQQLHLY